MLLLLIEFHQSPVVTIVLFVLVWQSGEFKSRGSLLLPGAPPTSFHSRCPRLIPPTSFYHLVQGAENCFPSRGCTHGLAKLQPVRITGPSLCPFGFAIFALKYELISLSGVGWGSVWMLCLWRSAHLHPSDGPASFSKLNNHDGKIYF